MRVGSVVRRSIFIVLAGEVGASSIGCEYLMLLTVSVFGYSSLLSGIQKSCRKFKQMMMMVDMVMVMVMVVVGGM